MLSGFRSLRHDFRLPQKIPTTNQRFDGLITHYSTTEFTVFVLCFQPYISSSYKSVHIRTLLIVFTVLKIAKQNKTFGIWTNVAFPKDKWKLHHSNTRKLTQDVSVASLSESASPDRHTRTASVRPALTQSLHKAITSVPALYTQTTTTSNTRLGYLISSLNATSSLLWLGNITFPLPLN